MRDGRLLVFRHTDYSYEEVGIQVPAGSVRPGGTPEDAALREAHEETGLTDFKIVRKLGETEYHISPYRFAVQRRHVFHLELTEPTPERWASQENHDGESEPTHFECFWVPLEAAHILQSGQGPLLGRLFDASAPHHHHRPGLGPVTLAETARVSYPGAPPRIAAILDPRAAQGSRSVADRA